MALVYDLQQSQTVICVFLDNAVHCQNLDLVNLANLIILLNTVSIINWYLDFYYTKFILWHDNRNLKDIQLVLLSAGTDA